MKEYLEGAGITPINIRKEYHVVFVRDSKSGFFFI